MNTATVKTQSRNRTAYQKVLKVKEEFEMRLAMRISQVNMRILATKTPVKLLGGLALGALVMAAAVLPLGPGLAYADDPARPFSMEQLENITDIFQTEVWLPGDTYPVPAFSGHASTALIEDLPGFMQTEIYLPGDTYPVAAYNGKVAKAESEDLPVFMQTEIWLPGDAYPVSSQAEDMPVFMQTEVWLPGDTYPVFGR
jgi:hypothetical protein